MRRLLCNALIQPHFDYACVVWYPNLKKNIKTRLQTLQNKCIRFCLHLDNRTHIGYDEFEKINWLTINDRFKQCVSSLTFKYWALKCPGYINDIFQNASQTNTRHSLLRLNQPLCKTNVGQKAVSYIAPSTWNSLPNEIKTTENLNTFKHRVKKCYLDQMKSVENNIYYNFS